MEYDAYHDESKIDGYWHGILLVPRKNRTKLLKYLEAIRKHYQHSRCISLKGLKRKHYDVVEGWISVGVDALIQDFKKIKVPKVYYKKIYHDGNRVGCEYNQLLIFDEPIGAKFILFKERDDHQKMNNDWFRDHTAKIETSFRMGLKGALHFLFSQENKVHLKSLHFDGWKHYQRQLNVNRLIDRGALRDYCYIDDFLEIDARTGNHDKPEPQEYNDCQLLQLTDLLVGSFRTVLGTTTSLIQKEVTLRVGELAKKWTEGPARMRNSRWSGGFCISECYLENGEWKFQSVPSQKKGANLNLFDNSHDL